MRKCIRVAPYTFFVLIFICSTMNLGMFKRMRKQPIDTQNLLYAKHLKKTISQQNIQEINQRIEETLKGIDRECIDELHALTSLPHNFLEKYIDLGREFIQISLKEDNRNAFHDPDMPKFMYDTAIKTLQENDINPRNVKLTYNTQEKIPGLKASAGGRLLFSGNHPIERIQIYELLAQDPDRYHEFSLGHETHHLLLGHSALKHLALPNKSNLFTSIIERQADLYTASKSSKLACSGAMRQCNNGHAQILDNHAHCREMIAMCELMKRKEELS